MEEYISIKYVKKGLIFKYLYLIVTVGSESHYCYTDSGFKSILERVGVSSEIIKEYLNEALNQENSILLKKETFFVSEKLNLKS